MSDNFKQRTVDLDSPARGGGELITPHNTNLIEPRPRWVQITGTGTLRAEIEDGVVLNYTAAEVATMQGAWPASYIRIHATGTDAGLRIRGHQ